MTLSFPSAGRIVFEDSKIFSSWRSPACKNFIEKTFGIEEVRQVEISTIDGQASISYVSEDVSGGEATIIRKLASVYRQDSGAKRHPVLEKTTLQLFPKSQPSLRIYRYGSTLSTWEPRLQTKGKARLRNPLILNKRHYAQFVERELMNLIGVARYEFHASAGSVSIEYDPFGSCSFRGTDPPTESQIRRRQFACRHALFSHGSRFHIFRASNVAGECGSDALHCDSQLPPWLPGRDP